ncbi:MAG: helix-turn-helix transcriptional regulator [Acidimicrobiales bacterium]
MALRRLRVARGLSQGDLAAGAGLGPKTPSAIELGSYRLRPETLARIVRSLVAPSDVDDVLDFLTGEFPLALAPSSPRAERIERRRDRRARRLERDTQRAMAILAAIEAEEQRLARVAAQRRERENLRRIRQEARGDLYQPPKKRRTR